MNDLFMEMKIAPIQKICCSATDFLKSGGHSDRNRDVNQRVCNWVMRMNTEKIKLNLRENYTFYTIYTVRFIGPAKPDDKSYCVSRP